MSSQSTAPSPATTTPPSDPAIPNGSGAASLLSAGIGACALAIIALLADRMPAFKHSMILYKPTGPLSGVTTSAIVVWLVAWLILELRWRRRNVRIGPISLLALLLLLASLLLTFPPLADAL